MKATGIGDGGRKDGMEYPPVRLQRGMRGPGLPSGLGSWPHLPVYIIVAYHLCGASSSLTLGDRKN